RTGSRVAGVTQGGYGVVSACEFRCRIGLCDTLPQITPVFRALYSVNPSSLRFFDQMLQRCGDLLRNYVEGLQRLLNTARIRLMMIIHAANPLFAWDCLEDSPSLQTIKDLLAALPDAKLLDSLRTARGKGRDDYPAHVLWGVVVLRIVLRHITTEAVLA